MEIKGMEEFQNNLKKVGDFTHAALVRGMEVCQGVVVNDAKGDHPWIKFGTPNPPGHPHPRYYTHTGQLTNSIRNGSIRPDRNQIEGEVKAGDSSLTAYAGRVEGLYPYMQPALEHQKDKMVEIMADAVKQVIK